MKLSKKYTAYLIHHSHTDIGYTHRPELTILKQVKYIYDLLNYFDEISSVKNHKWAGFRWVCETFVIVESFWKEASDKDRDRFIRYIKKGYISISGGYGNMSENLEPEIMDLVMKRVEKFSDQNNLTIDCAMQADVNGFSLGFAQALTKIGVKNYYACVHTHHGMYPIYAKHRPFYWLLPNGDKLLVWNGEHYMFGNALGFVPGAVAIHGFDDEDSYDKLNGVDSTEWVDLAANRVEKYITQLEEDGYQFNFITTGIHGKWTDNSMPNPKICDRVNKWNDKYGDQVEIKLSTLEKFFEILRVQKDIPTYSGEWPDWWTDGVGSAPRELKIHKNNQARYRRLLELESRFDLSIKVDHDEIIRDFVLYGEHTYGSWDSISNPYHAFTHEQWASKQWFAFNALKLVDSYEHKLLNKLGDVSEGFKVVKNWKVVNGNDTPIESYLRLYGDNNPDRVHLNGNYRVVDCEGKEYRYTLYDDVMPEIYLKLQPKEIKKFTLEVLDGKFKEKSHPFYSSYQVGGTDGVNDIKFSDHLKAIKRSPFIVTSSMVKTEDLSIKWDSSGVYSWYDKRNKIEAISERDHHSPFTPVYEVTPKTPRHLIGRNRKGIDVVRDCGKLSKVEIRSKTELFVIIEHHYTISGCDNYIVGYKIPYKGTRVEVKIRLDKKLERRPENLYISLGFAVNQEKSVWLGKGGEITQLWKDQLPGTLTDFYSVFEGIIVEDKGKGITIETPDTQLVQAGDLEFGDRVLFGDDELENREYNLYSWVMNNIWETNFILNLAGFYEFNYVVTTGSNYYDIKSKMREADGSNKGVTIIAKEE